MKVTPAILFLMLSAGSLGAQDISGGPGPRAVVSLTLMTDEFLAELLEPGRIRAFSRDVDNAVFSNVTGPAGLVKGRAWMNLELLLSLKPDLVVASDWTDPDGLDFLRTHGIPVTVVKTPRTWSDVKKRIGDLGSILGAQGRASSLLASLAARERALAAVRDRVTRPLSVLEYNSFGSSMGSGTLWDDLLTLSGVKNASGALAGDRYGYAALPIEMLVTLDPDWLVLPSQGALDAYGKADFLRNLQKDPVFRNLKAVKTGRILYLPEALKTSTSQAALGAAEAIQHAAYPVLF